ncbi:MAG: AEC family transporter [Gloeobacteraceae cyanobacterium ES-bin-144]|nr:AEC family transporter [Verrucomicrobiales bacterium]
MISAGEVVSSVLPVYLLIVAGAALRRTGIVRKEHDEGVMRVVYTVMLPCFILDKILGSHVLRSGSVVLSAMGMGFGLIMVGIALGFIVGRVIGLEKGTGMRTFALSSGCQNFGFTAAPVVEILWSTGTLALLFVHNIGVELAMWSVGVLIMSAERGIPWRKMLNGPVIAVIGGLLLVALGWDHHVVGPPRKALSLIGIGAFPLAILITGCTIMDLVVSERPTWKVIVGSAFVRLLLAPMAILTAAKFLPLAPELKQVLIVQAAMPAGMTSIMLARMYGGRPAIAVQVIVFTTLLSLFTLPWIITFGCQWIGLKPLLP